MEKHLLNTGGISPETELCVENMAIKKETKPGSSFQSISLSCSGLSYSINRTKILHNINLIADPGELLTIVGLSGAGKTTLLNCLAFRTRGGKVIGDIMFNGFPGTRRMFKATCNYIMTDGRLLPYLTVYETLMACAQLKLPNSTLEMRQDRVNNVIAELGLINCKDTYIGGEWKKGISTGERKRVSIAIELLDEPSILILDEPTSGLDSSLASDLIGTLRGIAHSGRTVICSVHQPTSQVWSMLDSVLVLGRGTVLYHAKAHFMKDYFARLGYQCPENYNPADFLMRLISSDILFDQLNYEDNGNNRESQDQTTTIEGSQSHEGDIKDCNEEEDEQQEDQQDNDHFTNHSGLGIFVDIENANGFVSSFSDIPQIKHTNDSRPLLKDSHISSIQSSSTVVDIGVLIRSFEESKEGMTIKKRISITKQSAIDNPLEHRINLKRQCCENTFETYFREISALYFRTFKNSIRNPVVCCVMLLVQALQGLILGGIFWQLTANVSTRPAYRMDPYTITNHPFSRVLIQGINGRQPLLDALELGVDGNSSQPLLRLFKDFEGIRKARNLFRCGLTHQQSIIFDKYPTFGTKRLMQNLTLDNMGDPDNILSDLIASTQLLDYFVMRHSWPKRHKSDDNGIWWTETAQSFSEALMNPYFTCLNLPKFGLSNEQSNDEDTQQPKSSLSETQLLGETHRRSLVTIGDTGLADAMYSLIGTGAKSVSETTISIIHHIRGCQSPVCQWFNEKYSTISDISYSHYEDIMAIINICGALFFAVANLGFASYDSLLTFPQERALFNRETANGLYRPLSYFIAKNMADLPFQLIPTIILITIFYVMIGIGSSFSQYIIFCLTCCGVTFAAYGFGYMVSACCSRMEVAVLAAPATLVIWLTIAGFFLRDDIIPKWIRWFSYFSFYKWGFFALISNQFRIGGWFGSFPNTLPLLIAGITETHIIVLLARLFLLGCGYRVLAFFALKYTNRTVGVKY